MSSSNGRAANRSFISRFERRHLTGRLAALFDEAVAQRRSQRASPWMQQRF